MLELWFVTISGIITIILIVVLSRIDPILGSSLGCLFFFLIMLSYYLGKKAAKILGRKEDDDG